jgi:hypothetical protein
MAEETAALKQPETERLTMRVMQKPQLFSAGHSISHKTKCMQGGYEDKGG